MDRRYSDPKAFVEGGRDHKQDQNDFSIPLWLAGIVFISILSAIFH